LQNRAGFVALDQLCAEYSPGDVLCLLLSLSYAEIRHLKLWIVSPDTEEMPIN
jgi:hypothetical protein